MRIISGTLRGREIRTPRGGDTRPAMGKTREAVFSMLEARGIDWQGARILDLFAGTGSLAFEALSRGAAYAVMVDNSQDISRLLHANCADLGLEQVCRPIKSDVIRFLRDPPANGFDLVFVDPPYRRNFAAPVLKLLVERNWLAPGAHVAAELEKDLPIAAPDSLALQVERPFGQTMVRIWKNV